MEISWIQLFIWSLAAFRLTRLIVYDTITERLRTPFMEEVLEEGEVYLIPRKKGLRGWIGQLISCYWCTGVWSSIFIILLYWQLPTIGFPIIVILAVAGLAAIFETIVQFFIQEE